VSCNYTGMLALRLPGTMHHSPAMVALSVVIAVVVALVALRLTFNFRDGTTGGSRWRKPVSALVMGLAIPALHYAAMAGASFTSSDTLSGDMSYAVGSSLLGSTALTVGTVVVLGLALLAAYADRRITAARQEKAQALRHSEARLRALWKPRWTASSRLIMRDASSNSTRPRNAHSVTAGPRSSARTWRR
jgi:hypothetical protein